MKQLPLSLLLLAGLFLRLGAADEAVFDADEMRLVRTIRERIVARAQEEQSDPAKPYEQRIPGSDVTYTMLPVPAGTFRLGSPPDEPGRNDDEGPQVSVTLPAFWMGRCEVTWDEYEIFMFASDATEPGEPSVAVSHPTKPYVDMTFGMGREGFPAVNVTHHAASKYCQWLSAKTGHFYRLPTEAEWEYAARAGTATAYSFGDDPAELPAYAHFGADQYSQVGKLKPNPWGLYDMHGNAEEWTLDQYLPDAYARYRGRGYVPSTRPYPHVVRGGSWNDGPERLRSAARRGSDPDWKMLDPQLPKSVWYHTSVPWVGFRIVRQREIPPAEEMYRYWNNGVAEDEG